MVGVVTVAAGVAALTSAVPILHAHRVALGVSLVLLHLPLPVAAAHNAGAALLLRFYFANLCSIFVRTPAA